MRHYKVLFITGVFMVLALGTVMLPIARAGQENTAHPEQKTVTINVVPPSGEAAKIPPALLAELKAAGEL